MRAWLSAALARPFVVAQVAGLADWSEAQRLAEAAAAGATGLVGECVVQIEGWPEHCKVLATAVERDTLRDIELACSAHGSRLASVRPAWASPLNRLIEAPDSPRLTCFDDADGSTLFVMPDGEVEVTLTLHPAPDAAHLRDLIARLSSSHDVARDAAALQRFDPLRFDGESLGWSSIQHSGTQP